MSDINSNQFEVIPAIDLLDGGCVRLYQGDFSRVQTYEADPVELARKYHGAGSGLLHVVDLDGAKSGSAANLDTLQRIVDQTGISVQTGGGIRSSEDARDRLARGISRLVIGSLAVESPEQVAGWIDEIGTDHIVLGLDVRLEDGIPVLQKHGWTDSDGQSLWSLMDFFTRRGARHFLCTDIARDGTLAGPNTQLYGEIAARYPDAQIQASGGVSSVEDLDVLAGTGASAAITGKALLDGRISIEELRSFSPDA